MPVFIFYILTLLLVLGCGGNHTDSTSISNDLCLSKAIVNGTGCAQEKFSVAEIEFLTPNLAREYCSGVFLSTQTVLTAGHCLNATQALSIKVNYRGSSESVYKTVLAPGYRTTPSAILNDAAILFIRNPLPVTPTPLVLSHTPNVGEKISIFGFGYDEHETRGELRYGSMTLSNITAELLSAVYTGDEANTCNGDSGGPAFYSFMTDAGIDTGLIGITSAGTAITNRCGSGETSLFTNIQNDSVFRFILDTVPRVEVR